MCLFKPPSIDMHPTGRDLMPESNAKEVNAPMFGDTFNQNKKKGTRALRINKNNEKTPPKTLGSNGTGVNII